MLLTLVLTAMHPLITAHTHEVCPCIYYEGKMQTFLISQLTEPLLACYRLYPQNRQKMGAHLHEC
jgi:hypothetical protein